MRILAAAFVPVTLAALFTTGCVVPSRNPDRNITQRDHLVVEGKKADVLFTKVPGQMTVSIIARQKKSKPIDWLKVKVELGCFPTNFPGGFSYEMRLTGANTVKGRRASATFVFKAETPLIDDIGDVEVSSVGDPLWFKLPLSHNEVFKRFRMRASCDELQELERVRRSKNQDDQDRALEMVLCKLTWYEQERAGVPVEPSFIVSSTAPKDVDCFSGHYPPGTCTLNLEWWAIAGAGFSFWDPGARAVDAGFERANIGPICTGGPGLSWYVPREDFFRARRILLAAKIKGLYISEPPGFHF